MRTLAVANQKGGSGKTTTAVNVAAALGEMGRRVLLIDLDPQASASGWLGVVEDGRGLLDVFTDNVPVVDLVRESETPGVDVVPATTWLTNTEKALAGEPGAETVFRGALRKLPKERWELLLVDCPPALGLLTVSALTAVQEVLVPVEASVMALAGLAQLMRTVEVVQERLNPDLVVTAVLACRVDARTNLSREVVERLRKRFGKLVLKTMVRENVRLAEAPSHGQPITQYDPRSHGAEDYRAVAVELLKRNTP